MHRDGSEVDEAHFGRSISVYPAQTMLKPENGVDSRVLQLLPRLGVSFVWPNDQVLQRYCNTTDQSLYLAAEIFKSSCHGLGMRMLKTANFGNNSKNRWTNQTTRHDTSSL